MPGREETATPTTTEPDYIRWLRQWDTDSTRFELELRILQTWDRLQGHEEWLSFGTRKSDHRLACMREWAPGLEQHEWMTHKVEAFEKLEEPDQRMAHFIGATNSSKSYTLAYLLVQVFIEDPEYIEVSIAGPFKEASESGIWQDVVAAYKLVAPMMGWDAEKTIYKSSTSIVAVPGIEKAGYMRVIAIDKIGMLQGRKPRSAHRGWLLYVLEETGTFQKQAAMQFWGALQNLINPMRFRLMSTANFKSIHGLDGMLCKPARGTWNDLHVDVHHQWDSVRRGIVYRYDGHRSPNVLAGGDPNRPKYLYLVGKREIDDMIAAGFGPDSPKYMEQIRSFPITAAEVHTITTDVDIRAGKAYERPQYTQEPVTRYAFIDPSLGGDQFYLVVAERRREYLEKGEGNSVFVVIYHEKAPISLNYQATSNDVRVMGQLNARLEIQAGDIMPPEQQGAFWVAQQLDRWKVPRQNVGYDGSMRASIVRAMDAFLGSQTLGLDFEHQGAPEIKMPSGQGIAKDLYADLQTTLWFLAADMLSQGQWREMDRFPEAARQLTERLWEHKGNKRKLEDKKDFIPRNANKSPDEADAFAGLCYVAFIRTGTVQRNSDVHQWLMRQGPGNRHVGMRSR